MCPSIVFTLLPQINPYNHSFNLIVDDPEFVKEKTVNMTEAQQERYEVVKQRREVLEQQLTVNDLEDIRKLYKLVEEEDLNILDGANGVLVEHMHDLFKGYNLHDAQTISDTT